MMERILATVWILQDIIALSQAHSSTALRMVQVFEWFIKYIKQRWRERERERGYKDNLEEDERTP